MHSAADTNVIARTPPRLSFRLLSDPWFLGVAVVALAVAMPILTVVGFLFQPSIETWRHLASTVLDEYIGNSLLLMLGVAVGTSTMGVISAWLTSMYSFPGRRVFEWALLLPMAIPAYIIAYTYTGLLEFAGPVQTTLREWFGWSYGDYWFPEVRSLNGAIAMLSLVLYPYVYLLSRAAFLEQSICVLEVSRTLGSSQWDSFRRVALPLARPAVVAGMSLALMETLADYGTVQYFGVSTFTTGIFRTWFGLGDPAAAAQLAALLMGFVFVLILLERWSRQQARFHHTTNRYTKIAKIPLAGWRAWLAFLACLMPLFWGFVVPVAQLSVWAWQTAPQMLDKDFWELVGNTFMLAGIAAILALLLALFLAYGNRLRGGAPLRFLIRLSAMGYAVPGTVIAVGVLIPFGWFDNRLDAWARDTLGFSTGLLLSGTLFILLFAYCVRFLSVSLQTVESGLGKIRPSMDDAAAILGYKPLSILARVHLPIMRGSLLTAVLLVFVDVMKELPATLIMRPFNFNTLAVRTYELASDERLAEAAVPALAIVLVGIVPVLLLSRTISRSRPGHRGAA